jgi:hypothetical protein
MRNLRWRRTGREGARTARRKICGEETKVSAGRTERALPLTGPGRKAKTYRCPDGHATVAVAHPGRAQHPSNRRRPARASTSRPTGSRLPEGPTSVLTYVRHDIDLHLGARFGQVTYPTRRRSPLCAPSTPPVFYRAARYQVTRNGTDREAPCAIARLRAKNWYGAVRDGTSISHNPKVAGSNPAPATI